MATVSFSQIQVCVGCDMPDSDVEAIARLQNARQYVARNLEPGYPQAIVLFVHGTA